MDHIVQTGPFVCSNQRDLGAFEGSPYLGGGGHTAFDVAKRDSVQVAGRAKRSAGRRRTQVLRGSNLAE
jgi:hypothetical protein